MVDNEAQPTWAPAAPGKCFGLCGPSHELFPPFLPFCCILWGMVQRDWAPADLCIFKMCGFKQGTHKCPPKPEDQLTPHQPSLRHTPQGPHPPPPARRDWVRNGSDHPPWAPQCLDPIVTIAAFMSLRSPFVQSVSRRVESKAAYMKFATAQSDHLTLWTVYQKWLEVKGQGRGEREFCLQNFLSSKTLNTIEQLKRQLMDNLADLGFVTPDSNRNAPSINVVCVCVVLCCVVLCCVVLCCVVLCCVVLCCVVLCSVVFCCVVLCCVAPSMPLSSRTNSWGALCARVAL